MSKEAERVFWSAYKRQDMNFMTPHREGYYLIPNGAVELSSGSRILGDGLMYGVTVVMNGKPNHDASKCLHSRDEAMRYIQELQNGELLEKEAEAFHKKTWKDHPEYWD